MEMEEREKAPRNLAHSEFWSCPCETSSHLPFQSSNSHTHSVCHPFLCVRVREDAVLAFSPMCVSVSERIRGCSMRSELLKMMKTIMSSSKSRQSSSRVRQSRVLSTNRGRFSRVVNCEQAHHLCHLPYLSADAINDLS